VRQRTRRRFGIPRGFDRPTVPPDFSLPSTLAKLCQRNIDDDFRGFPAGPSSRSLRDLSPAAMAAVLGIAGGFCPRP